jgi:hypothetical protein
MVSNVVMLGILCLKKPGATSHALRATTQRVEATRSV